MKFLCKLKLRNPKLREPLKYREFGKPFSLRLGFNSGVKARCSAGNILLPDGTDKQFNISEHNGWASGIREARARKGLNPKSCENFEPDEMEVING
jgi:hypothetical protein